MTNSELKKEMELKKKLWQEAFKHNDDFNVCVALQASREYRDLAKKLTTNS